MEDFKQYLNPDADEAERQALDKIREGLAGLRLEAKVAQAAAARRAFQRRRFLKKAVTLGIGLLILGACLFYVLAKKHPESPVANPPNQLENQSQPTENQSPATQPEKPAPRKNVPIAERPLTKIEQAEKPLLRSAKPDLDSTTNWLVDTLLKITVYHAQKVDSWFEPDTKDNKKLTWGNAVHALFQNKPAEAKSFIFQLEKMDTLEAQWLLAIALLEEGKLDEAEALFEKIAKNPKHWRREAAAVAVAKLQE